jgi:hypothetical protein
MEKSADECGDVLISRVLTDNVVYDIVEAGHDLPMFGSRAVVQLAVE